MKLPKYNLSPELVTALKAYQKENLHILHICRFLDYYGYYNGYGRLLTVEFQHILYFQIRSIGNTFETLEEVLGLQLIRLKHYDTRVRFRNDFINALISHDANNFNKKYCSILGRLRTFFLY